MKFQSPITLGDKGKANIAAAKKTVGEIIPDVEVSWVAGRKIKDAVSGLMPTFRFKRVWENEPHSADDYERRQEIWREVKAELNNRPIEEVNAECKARYEA